MRLQLKCLLMPGRIICGFFAAGATAGSGARWYFGVAVYHFLSLLRPSILLVLKPQLFFFLIWAKTRVWISLDYYRETSIPLMAMTSLPPGFRFHPTDVELTVYYLKRKLLGKKLRCNAVTDIDLYKFAPWDLPGAFSLPVILTFWRIAWSYIYLLSVFYFFLYIYEPVLD